MTDLPALITRLTTAITANEAAMCRIDHADRFRLQALTDQLQRYRDRAQVGIDQLHRRHDTEILLGANARGPAIDDLIRQSEGILSAVEWVDTGRDASERRAA